MQSHAVSLASWQGNVINRRSLPAPATAPESMGRAVAMGRPLGRLGPPASADVGQPTTAQRKMRRVRHPP